MASPPPTAAAAAAEVRADAAEDAGRPSPRPSTAAVSSQAAAPPATAYAGVRPTAPVTGAVAGYGYRPAETPPAPAAGYRTAAAPQPAYRAPVPVPAPVPTYRAAAPAPSTFAAPTYAARAPAIASEDTPRVASLTPPRYTPSYPAGGFSPSLGRERPIAPALSAGALTPTEIAAAGRGRFVWPLRGQLISGFGDKGAGQHNDGVDIAAISGAGVHAAAAGEVVYAGSSIPGFGNLVLVKHSGGWVTAYAHLDRIEVRMRDSVSQGEEIGLAGQTGAVDRPQLHFEVRYAPDPADKARPVDPALVLPGG
jgi:murein DD-endopeptidase MepM/ murein hydrolase activator NlpD